jgi:phage tail tube protein FII
MDNVIRGANWWFDTINCWITLDEVEMPTLKRATEKFAPSGSALAVEFPEEFDALTAKIKLRNNDPRIRALCGREPGNWTTAYYYENLVSYRNGDAVGRVVVLKGLVVSVQDERKQRLKATTVEYDFGSIVYYHDMYAGKSIHKFDFFAGPGATLVDGVNPFGRMAINLAISGGA